MKTYIIDPDRLGILACTELRLFKRRDGRIPEPVYKVHIRKGMITTEHWNALVRRRAQYLPKELFAEFDKHLLSKEEKEIILMEEALGGHS